MFSKSSIIKHICNQKPKKVSKMQVQNGSERAHCLMKFSEGPGNMVIAIYGLRLRVEHVWVSVQRHCLRETGAPLGRLSTGGLNGLDLGGRVCTKGAAGRKEELAVQRCTGERAWRVGDPLKKGRTEPGARRGLFYMVSQQWSLEIRVGP